MIKELFKFEENSTYSLDIVASAKTLIDVLNNHGIDVSQKVKSSVETRSCFKNLIKSQGDIDLMELLKEERWNFEYAMDFSALLAVILPERSTKMNYITTDMLDEEGVIDLIASLSKVSLGDWDITNIKVSFAKNKLMEFEYKGKTFSWEFERLSIDFFKFLKKFSSENFEKGGFYIDLNGMCNWATYLDYELLQKLYNEF